MGSKPDRIRIQHMLDYARQAVAFARDTTFDSIIHDPAGRSLLLLSLITVGEAASRISQELRDRHADVPWNRVIGMRNRLVHAYHDINMDIIWETTTVWLPDLIQKLEQIIELEQRNEADL